MDVVVAAPGRAREHLSAGTLRLDACTAVVLDEADLLLSELRINVTSYCHAVCPSTICWWQMSLWLHACATLVLDEGKLMLSAATT